MIFSVLVLVACVFLVQHYWKQRKFRRFHEKVGSPLRSWPIIGHMYIMIGSDEDRMKSFQLLGNIALKHGGITSTWFGSRIYVVVTDPDIIEFVLKTCLEKDDVVKIAHELFGYGSIFAPVPIWHSRRKVIAPTFSMNNLNDFVKVFALQSSVMVEQLKGAAGNGTFSIWNYLTTYTMDSVCETALGINVEAQHNPDQPFLKAFDEHCKMASKRMCLPPLIQKAYRFLPIHTIYMKHIRTLQNFVDEIIKNKRTELKEKHGKHGFCDNSGQLKDSKPKTFLELYIESSGGASGFTNLELREETLVVLLAGTDTSAVGAAFTCLMLAMHQDIQQKVYEESQAVFSSSSRPVEPEDLPKLKYLEAVIKESLRLYPPVPIIVRKVDRDIKLPTGLEIPQGAGILINIWASHRNPKYWGQDADEFKPDRFLGASTHSVSFMPFSHGPRSCLGYQYAMMSMKTALVTLVRRYRLLPVEATAAPLRVKFDIMMKHVDNFKLQIEARP